LCVVAVHWNEAEREKAHKLTEPALKKRTIHWCESERVQGCEPPNSRTLSLRTRSDDQRDRIYVTGSVSSRSVGSMDRQGYRLWKPSAPSPLFLRPRWSNTFVRL